MIAVDTGRGVRGGPGPGAGIGGRGGRYSASVCIFVLYMYVCVCVPGVTKYPCQFVMYCNLLYPLFVVAGYTSMSANMRAHVARWV